MSKSPTLVFVAGAWHSASTWDKVTSLLEAQQYKCVPVGLPSTQSDPSVGFEDDVRAVRDAITAETTQGRDVVVILHSYGGPVGQTAIKGHTRPKEDKTDSSGHVIGLAIMASGFAIGGKNFIDGSGGKPPPTWVADSDGAFALMVADPRDMFYHDLPEAESKDCINKLTKQSFKALSEAGEHSYPGWKDVPCWFLGTIDDHTLPIHAQRHFVQQAKDDGADVTLREIESSHSPMLSKPKETADFIVEAAAYFVK